MARKSIPVNDSTVCHALAVLLMRADNHITAYKLASFMGVNANRIYYHLKKHTSFTDTEIVE